MPQTKTYSTKSIAFERKRKKKWITRQKEHKLIREIKLNYPQILLTAKLFARRNQSNVFKIFKKRECELRIFYPGNHKLLITCKDSENIILMSSSYRVF